MKTKTLLSHDDVAAMLAAAKDEALRNQWPVSISVCDDGGHMLGFVRLDGAAPMSASIAPAKARSAAMSRRESRLLEEMINNGRTAFLSTPGLEGMLEGGIPIMVDDQCVGAIGVSGVKSIEDAQVGKAGIAALRQAAGDRAAAH
jgi:uncharacterized protein GlcG (DUF336 family)